LLQPLAPADNAAMEAEPNKAATPKSKRRWFQFSLRTLLLVVTVFSFIAGGYTSWQRSIVNKRLAYLQAHSHFWENGTCVVLVNGDRTQAPSGIRIWLGDKPQDNVFVDSATREDTNSVALLFPEADILAWPEPDAHDDFRPLPIFHYVAPWGDHPW
jgi:hypothetical protein